MAEVLEDVQGLFPGLASGAGLSVGVLDFAEADQGPGLVVVVAYLGKQVNGAPVAVGGLPGAAEVVVAVAEAVPGIDLAIAVAELALQVQCLLAVDQAALVITLHGTVPADGVERSGLAGYISGPAEKV
jgi:hypothetical protein